MRESCTYSQPFLGYRAAAHEPNYPLVQTRVRVRRQCAAIPSAPSTSCAGPLRAAVQKRRTHVSKKLFVGGLAWATSTEGLHSAFEQFGPVSEAKVITDRDTGRSRGFGFVTYDSTEDADRAIKEMDGADLDGRRIRVNEAQPAQPRGRSRRN